MTKRSHHYSEKPNNPPQRLAGKRLSAIPGTADGVRNGEGRFDQVGYRRRTLRPPCQSYRTVRDAGNWDKDDTGAGVVPSGTR
jgi:hypothetical protein